MGNEQDSDETYSQKSSSFASPFRDSCSTLWREETRHELYTNLLEIWIADFEKERFSQSDNKIFLTNRWISDLTKIVLNFSRQVEQWNPKTATEEVIIQNQIAHNTKNLNAVFGTRVIKCSKNSSTFIQQHYYWKFRLIEVGVSNLWNHVIGIIREEHVNDVFNGI